jgi:hypothetical protein
LQRKQALSALPPSSDRESELQQKLMSALPPHVRCNGLRLLWASSGHCAASFNEAAGKKEKCRFSHEKYSETVSNCRV